MKTDIFINVDGVRKCMCMRTHTVTYMPPQCMTAARTDYVFSVVLTQTREPSTD